MGIDLGNSCSENIPYSTLPNPWPTEWVSFPNPLDPISPNTADLYDIPENFMSYASDACRNSFTPQQGDRMRADILLDYSLLSSATNLEAHGLLNNQPCFPNIGVLSAEISINSLDPCSGNIDLAAISGIPWIDNVSYDWEITLNGNSVFSSTLSQITASLPTIGNYLVELTTTAFDGTTASSSFEFNVVDCGNSCSLICNNGFESNYLNLEGLDGSIGAFFNTCNSGNQMVTCWNSHGLAHIVGLEPNPFSEAWGAYPILPINLSPGNINSFSSPPFPSANSKYARISRAFDNGNDLNGSLEAELNTSTTLGENYVLEFNWAAQSNIQDNEIDAFSVQIGLTNQSCNGLADGTFPQAPINFNFQPLQLNELEWHTQSEVFAGDGADHLQISLIETQPINQANYFNSLFVDDVFIISENDNPVSFDFISSQNVGCSVADLNVELIPDIISSTAYLNSYTYQIVAFDFFGVDITNQITFTGDASVNGLLTAPQGVLTNNGSFTFNFSADLTNADANQVYFSIVSDDQNSCIGISPWTTVNVNTPYALLNVEHISCQGACDGTIGVSALADGTFLYDDPNLGLVAFSDGVNDLCPGSYSVIWTSEDGLCQETFNIEILEPSNALAVTLNEVSPACTGGLGSANVQGSSGWTGLANIDEFIFEWFDSNNNLIGSGASITNLPPGNYTLLVEFNVQANAQADLDGDQVLELISGSFQPNSYSVPGCVSQVPFTIAAGQNPGPTITSVNPACQLPVDGSITADNPGLAWTSTLFQNETNLGTSGNWMNLGIGEYLVISTDANGCFQQDIVTLDNPNCCVTNPMTGNIADTGNACSLGNASFELDLSVNGGFAPYSYSWTFLDFAWSTEEDILDALSGSTYEVTVTDAFGCELVLSVTTPDSEAPDVFVWNTQDESCIGAGDGLATILALPTTTTSLFDVNWFDTNNNLVHTDLGVGASTASNLSQGDYTVFVTDPQTGCTVTEIVTIELGYINPFVLSLTETEIDCFDQNAIDLSVTGGAPSFNIEWVELSDPTTVIWTSEDLTGISQPGIYQATVTDASGCSNQTQTIQTSLDFIPMSDDIQLQFTTETPCISDVPAETGSIDLTVILPDGNGSESFTWLNSSDVLIGTSEDITNLNQNIYQINYVNSVHGCATAFVPINFLLGPAIDFSVTPGCPGICNGVLLAEVIGGTGLGTGPNWQITGDDQNFLVCNPPGYCPDICPDETIEYTVSSTAPNGCTTSIDAGILGIAEDCCPELLISVSHTGLHYPGSFGSILIEITNPGQTTYSAFDLNTNFAALDFIPTNYILDNSAPVNSLPQIPVINSGQTIILEVQGWFNTPGTKQLDLLLSYADQTNCDDVFNASHLFNVLLQCPADWTSLELSCQDPDDIASTCLQFFYGYPQDGEDYVSGFSIELTYDPGFIDLEGIDLSAAAELQGGVINSTTTNPTGIIGLSGEENIEISVAVSFTNPVAFYNNFGGTEATLNEPLCVSFSPSDLNVPLGVNNTIISSAVTYLSMVDVAGTDQQNNGFGETYSGFVWTDGAFVLFTEDTPDACFSGIQAPDPAFTLAPNAPYCTLDQISAFANVQEGFHIWEITTPIDYVELWGQSTIQIETATFGEGEYTILHTIIDSEGIAAQASSSIMVSASSPSIEETTIINATCPFPNGSAEVTLVSGGLGELSFLWDDEFSTENELLDQVLPNNYTVTVTDEAGCQSSEAISILQDNAGCCGDAVLDFTVDQPECGLDFGIISIDVTGGLGEFNISVFDNQGVIVEPNELIPGDYSITAINEFNCEIQANFTILQPTNPPFTVSFSLTEPSCPTSADGFIAANVAGGDGNYTYEWSSAGEILGTLADLLWVNQGTYQFTVTDGSNCSYSEEVTLDATDWTYPEDLFVGLIGNGTDIIDVAEAELWNNQDISFGGNLIIQSGVELELSNVNFTFGIFSEVIIEEEAELDCVNCSFDACSEMWLGINLASDATTPENPAFIKLDGGSISNALNGLKAQVTNWNGVYTQSNINSWRAGRIDADNIQFINNRVSVDVRKSSFLNNSIVGFDNCQFTVNDENRFIHLGRYGLTPVFAFSQHVYYNQVRGYNFTNCIFENSMEINVDEWPDRGSAIKAVNANFTVNNEGIQNNINPYQNTHFKGFSKAIYAHVFYSPWNGMRVLNATFDKNKVAIYTSNVCFHTIADNFIRVGEPTGDVDIDLAEDYEGIVIMGGAGFAVAQNTLNGSSLAPSGSNTFGVRVRDTRTDDDEIYKNYFFDLNYANLANGENIPPEGQAFGGLRYVCNENTNNQFDFTVSDFNLGQGPEVLAIARNQNATGEDVDLVDNLASAGNSFTSNPTEAFGHFWNEGEFIYYLPTPSLIPININGNVNNLTFTQNYSCPVFSQIVKPGEAIDFEKYHLSKNNSDESFIEWQNSKFLYASIIDEGDTEELKNEVELSWPEDTWTMRDKLLGISPNVSKTVLKEVADKTTVYPHPVALEIFLANPDILKDAHFLSYLETKPDPMPAYMIDLLYLARDARTFRTELETEMNYFRSLWMQSNYDLIRANLQIEDSLALSLTQSQLTQGLSIEMNSIFSSLESGTSSISILDNIADYHPKMYLSEEYEQLDLFLAWSNSITSTGRTWSEANASEVLQLENIADYYDTFSGRVAQEILNDHFDQNWFTPPAVGGNWTPKVMVYIDMESENIQSINVYPNPASVIVTVEIQLAAGETGNSFMVVDGNGRVIYTQDLSRQFEIFSINTTEWASGSYTYLLKSNNSEKSGTFIIQH